MMVSLFSNPPDAKPIKQPQAAYGSHPPSYSQSMSGQNSSLPSNESISVLNQQQQQQQQQQLFGNQLQQQLSTDSESSFRLIDDSIRIANPMQLCTPPKQSKPSSIFSPDWKDTQGESNNANMAASGKSRSQGHPTGIGAGLTKPIKDSPSSREKNPMLPSYPDQHQQQQQSKQRSDTPKKEHRTNDALASAGHQSQKAGD